MFLTAMQEVHYITAAETCDSIAMLDEQKEIFGNVCKNNDNVTLV